ncbi:MAG: hypothetical protein HN348_16130, partial [Proteobacteria bacterium]|nr:hypothetical protein [Pseudomonadota bacterium]
MDITRRDFGLGAVSVGLAPSLLRHRARPTIKVVGVGGAGGCLLNQLVERGMNADFMAIDVDGGELSRSLASTRVQLDKRLVTASFAEIPELNVDADIVVVLVGMGGRTGTVVAPIVARHAKGIGGRVVVVASRPFEMEGRRRLLAAKVGMDELLMGADMLMSPVANRHLTHMVSERATFQALLKFAHSIQADAIEALIELLNHASMRTLARLAASLFARTAVLSVGSAGGPTAYEAALRAVCSATMNPRAIATAKWALIRVKCARRADAEKVVATVRDEIPGHLGVRWGWVEDWSMDEVLVTVLPVWVKRGGPGNCSKL